MKIIGVMNYKGGVGKTTTTMNLGTALWILGKRVLLVDADQQCNLTVNMKFEKAGNDTLNELMRGQVKSYPIWERYEGLDYMPASDELKSIELYLKSLRNPNYVLKQVLEPLRGEYDYILIDCTPKSGVMNDNVMVAADAILIPSDCGPYSLTGMDTLKADIEEMQSLPYLNPKLELIGIVRTNFEKRLKVSRETNETLEQLFPGKLLDVTISRCSKVNDAPRHFMSMFELDAESTTANDYMRLAEIIDGRKRPTNWKTKAIKNFNRI